jgi:hypothetical protein
MRRSAGTDRCHLHFVILRNDAAYELGGARPVKSISRWCASSVRSYLKRIEPPCQGWAVSSAAIIIPLLLATNVAAGSVNHELFCGFPRDLFFIYPAAWAGHFWINRTIELVAPPDFVVGTTQLFSRTSVADDWLGLGLFAHMDGRHAPGEVWIVANLQPVHDAAERHSAAAVYSRFSALNPQGTTVVSGPVKKPAPDLPKPQGVVDARKRLSKRAKRGFQGYPIATVALYGPDDRAATKLTASEHAEAIDLRRWFSEGADIRHDAGVAEEVLAFIDAAGARSTVMTDRIIGCPHEEGIDYQGPTCPSCPFWAGRDRWTGSAYIKLRCPTGRRLNLFWVRGGGRRPL